MTWELVMVRASAPPESAVLPPQDETRTYGPLTRASAEVLVCELARTGLFTDIKIEEA